MSLNVDFRRFLDEQGNPLELTEQAKRVFVFLRHIVSKVSVNLADNNGQSAIDVNLHCNTRAENLSCAGGIEAVCDSNNVIEWHCDVCEACGTISHWQASHWDKQARTIH